MMNIYSCNMSCGEMSFHVFFPFSNWLFITFHWIFRVLSFFILDRRPLWEKSASDFSNVFYQSVASLFNLFNRIMEQKCVILTRFLPIFPVMYHVWCQMCVPFLKISLSYLSKHFVVIILMSSSSSLYLGKFILHAYYFFRKICNFFVLYKVNNYIYLPYP